MVQLYYAITINLRHDLQLSILVLLVLEHMLQSIQSARLLLFYLTASRTTKYTLPKVPVPIKSTA